MRISGETDISKIRLKLTKEFSTFFKEVYTDFVKAYLDSKKKDFVIEVDPSKEKSEYEIILEV